MVTWQFCERRKSCVPENLFMKISLLCYCILHYVFNVIKKKNSKKIKKSEVKKKKKPKNEKWDVGVGVKWMGRVGKKNEKIFTFFISIFFFKFVNISWQDDFFFFSFFLYSIFVFFFFVFLLLEFFISFQF